MPVAVRSTTGDQDASVGQQRRGMVLPYRGHVAYCAPRGCSGIVDLGRTPISASGNQHAAVKQVHRGTRHSRGMHARCVVQS